MILVGQNVMSCSFHCNRSLSSCLVAVWCRFSFEQVLWCSDDVYYLNTIICKLYWYTVYEIDTLYL